METKVTPYPGSSTIIKVEVTEGGQHYTFSYQLQGRAQKQVLCLNAAGQSVRRRLDIYALKLQPSEQTRRLHLLEDMGKEARKAARAHFGLGA